jgi:cold-inducible RNA-binding protein
MGARVYIGNLSFDTTQSSLETALAGPGRTVKEVHLVMDRDTGRPRGFAFAELANSAEAQAVIEQMNGMMLDGRTLTVNEAKDRPHHGNGAHSGNGVAR